MVRGRVETVQRGLGGGTPPYPARAGAATASGRHVDGFYHPIRRHAAPGRTSPARFGKLAPT
jgi:hypothetical protein